MDQIPRHDRYSTYRSRIFLNASTPSVQDRAIVGAPGRHNRPSICSPQLRRSREDVDRRQGVLVFVRAGSRPGGTRSGSPGGGTRRSARRPVSTGPERLAKSSHVESGSRRKLVWGVFVKTSARSPAGRNRTPGGGRAPFIPSAKRSAIDPTGAPSSSNGFRPSPRPFGNVGAFEQHGCLDRRMGRIERRNVWGEGSTNGIPARVEIHPAVPALHRESLFEVRARCRTPR